MNQKIKTALDERNKLWAEGDKLWAEGRKLWAEGEKLRAEGDKLRAEGDKLWAEGEKLWAEADIQFYQVIIDELGPKTEVKWLTETSCEIQNEIYE
jgi:hypothetical protein